MAIRGTLTHRKTRRLAKLLRIDPCFALGIIEAVWHLTGDQQPDGGIGRLSDEDICDEILYSGDSSQLIAFMVEVGLLDRTDQPHRLFVHDWHEWADYHVSSKLLKDRKRFANGELPNLSKYGKDARAKIIADYDGEPPTVREMRTTSEPAQPAHDAHGAPNALSRARHGRASRPEPEPEPETNVCASGEISDSQISPFVRSSPPAEEEKPSRPSGPIAVPRKPMEPPHASTRKITLERIAAMRNALHGYMAMQGTSYERQVGLPDDAIVLRCLEATGYASHEAVFRALRDLWNSDQSPRHPNGPKSYAWFPAVLGVRFRDCPVNLSVKSEMEPVGART